MNVILLGLLMIIAPIPAFALTSVDSLRFVSRLDSMVTVRMDTLEARWGVTFDDTQRPGVRLGLPTEIPAGSRWMYMGVYRTDSMTISLEPPLHYAPGLPWPLAIVVDHELVHVYCDQYSRKRGRGRWPSVAHVDTTSLASMMALRFQVEGIAEAATSPIPFNRTVPLKQWLPSNPKQMIDPGLGSNMWTYCGGRALVQPLLDAVGLERTVEYVQTHPVNVRGRSFRSALLQWEKQARRDLGVAP